MTRSALLGGIGRRTAWAVLAAGLLLLASSILLQAGKQHRQFRDMHQQQLRQAVQQTTLMIRSRIGNAEVLLRWITERTPRDANGGWETLRAHAQQEAGFFGTVSILPSTTGTSFTLGAREFELTAREREQLGEGRTLLLAPHSPTGEGRLYLMRELKENPPRRRVLAEMREGWWQLLLDARSGADLAAFDGWGQVHFSSRTQVPQVAAQGLRQVAELPSERTIADLAWN